MQRKERLSVPAYMATHGLFDVAPQEALKALHEAGYKDVTSGLIYVARNSAKKRGARVAPAPGRKARVSAAPEVAAPEPPSAKTPRAPRAPRATKPSPAPGRPGLKRARYRDADMVPPAIANLSPEEREFVRLGLQLGVNRTTYLSGCVTQLLRALYGEKAA